MIKVNEFMNTNVVTMTASQNILQAKELMDNKHIRHIPVVNEEGYPVGLISQRDILKAQGSEFSNHAQQVIDENTVAVSDIMTTKINYVTPNDSLRSAGLILQKHKYGCLPVMDNNKLVGIITDSDFVSVAIDLIEQMDFNEEF